MRNVFGVVDLRHTLTMLWAVALGSAVVSCRGQSVQEGAAEEAIQDEANYNEGDGLSPLLTIGSPAPPLDIEHWISDRQGEFKPVTQFAKGKVYVVEFWATWCGPCVQSMPHLVAVQNELAARGVQIISVSDEDLPTVQEFLSRPYKGGSPDDAGAEEGATEAPATYGELTSAYCLTCDPDGSTQRDYMEAAGQGGIPTCFIVGKTGQIEWIGHPMTMDEPLMAVTADKWDRDAFREQIVREQQRQRLMQELRRKLQAAAGDGDNFDAEAMLAIVDETRAQVQDDAEMLDTLDRLESQIKVSPIVELIEQGEFDQADAAWNKAIPTASPNQLAQMESWRFQALMSAEEYLRAAKALTAYAGHKDASPEVLNGLAWGVAQAANEMNVSSELLDAAAAAAESALTARPNDASILDTLAHVLDAQGDTQRAIEAQEKAIEAADGNDAELRAYLDELRAKL